MWFAAVSISLLKTLNLLPGLLWGALDPYLDWGQLFCRVAFHVLWYFITLHWLESAPRFRLDCCKGYVNCCFCSARQHQVNSFLDISCWGCVASPWKRKGTFLEVSWRQFLTRQFLTYLKFTVLMLLRRTVLYSFWESNSAWCGKHCFVLRTAHCFGGIIVAKCAVLPMVTNFQPWSHIKVVSPKGCYVFLLEYHCDMITGRQ